MSLAAYHDEASAKAATARGGEAVSPPAVEIFTDFAAAAPLWRGLTARGCSTPYQSFEWCESYMRHVEAPLGGRAALIVLRDRQGLPSMLLPLVIRSRGPLKIASFIGGKHSNFAMPIIAAGAVSPGAGVLDAALRAAGRAAGADVLSLTAQPFAWEGFVNPLAILPGQPAASAGYKLALQADGEALLAHRLSKDTRKKLRQKEQKLAQRGAVTYVRPQSPDEARALLAEFLRFKSQRFEAQGIDDPFAGDAIRAFLDEAVTAGAAEGRAVIGLHALKAGERVVAIYGGLSDANRFCGLFTAFDSDPEIARSSPGDILLMAMIRQACRDGLATFDLGVGEARYKAQVCDQREDLFDLFLPVTLQGRLAATVLGAAMQAKRRIKASPALVKLVAAARRLRARPAA